MDNAVPGAIGDICPVTLTYERSSVRKLSLPDGCFKSSASEALTVNVSPAGSIEIRVATDARGTIRRVTHHESNDKTGVRPGVFDANGFYPCAYDLPLPEFEPAMTSVIALDSKDTIVHVTVTDLKSGASIDRFVKLEEWRSDKPEQPRAWTVTA